LIRKASVLTSQYEADQRYLQLEGPSSIGNMAPPNAPPVPGPFSRYHDVWNSSATGHQRAENKIGGSTGWRQSRSLKLSHQYKSEGTGGKRISDQVGAGSEDWDEKAGVIIPKDMRRSKVNIKDMLLAGKNGKNHPFSLCSVWILMGLSVISDTSVTYSKSAAKPMPQAVEKQGTDAQKVLTQRSLLNCRC
jgi:hypothetical protein